MGHSKYDPAAKERHPWNVGRIVGAKRALKPQQVWAIRFWLERERRLRDRAMFDLAIDSKWRGCDVVKVKLGDLVSGGRVRSRAIVIQQKTVAPFISSSPSPPASAFWPGSNTDAGRLKSSSFLLCSWPPARRCCARRWTSPRHCRKVLAGGAPADLPIERPTKFELIINTRAAKTLGVGIPPGTSARRRTDRIGFGVSADG